MAEHGSPQKDTKKTRESTKTAIDVSKKDDGILVLYSKQAQQRRILMQPIGSA
jgi:hypothetical protein